MSYVGLCQHCGREILVFQSTLCPICFRRYLEPAWPKVRVLLPPDMAEEDVQALVPALTRWLLEGHEKPHNPIPPQRIVKDPLGAGLMAACHEWRYFATVGNEYVRIANSIDRTTEFLILMLYAIVRRREYRRILRHRVYFDTRQGRFLRRVAVVDIKERLSWATILVQRAGVVESMFLSGLNVFLSALGIGRQVIEATDDAVQAVRQTIQESVPLLVGLGMDSPFPAMNIAGNIALAGWAASNLSLKHNPRLARALDAELAMLGEVNPSLSDKLRQYLPANTYRAWHEGEWKRLPNLLTRIAYLVEHDISEQSHQEFSHDTPWQAAPHPLENPTYEEVAKKLEEEDQYMAWIIKEANLTPLEADVTRLKVQDSPSTHSGDRFTEQEIANMLDHRSLGSVKQAWQRAQPKLGRVLKRIINE